MDNSVENRYAKCNNWKKVQVADKNLNTSYGMLIK